MKKFLRFVVILILVVVAGVLILAAIEPTDVTVTRNTFINAPKNVVFAQISSFRNWTHWSPWYKMDSGNMKMTYTGPDGQPGGGYSWEGSKKTGSGEMKCNSINGTTMNFDVHFIKPFDGHAAGIFKVEDGDKGMTKVTWSLTMHQSFPLNAMNAFFNSDKYVGADFERGLADMKAYVEANATAMPAGAAITETNYPGHLFAGVRKTIPMNEIGNFFMTNMSNLGKELGNRITGPGAGIYYVWDTAHHTTDCAAVFPVADSSKPVAGATYINVAASKAIMAVHTGGYSSVGAEHMALMKYAAEKGKKPTLVIEEYVKGAYQEKDSTKWITNIYYLVP
jgi:effector-binding domain-containing protein